MTNRQKKRLAITFLVIVGALGGSYFALLAVEVNDYVYGSGWITTALRSEVRSAEKHAIRNILVEDGARVEKGQVLIELEETDLLGTIKEREAEVRLIEAELEHQRALNKEAIKAHEEALGTARIHLQNAQSEYERARKLLGTDAISAEEIDRKRLSFEVAGQRFEAENTFTTEAMDKEILVLQRRLELAKHQLRRTNEMLKDRRITSPISGILSLRTLAVGEIIEPARVIGEVFDTSSFVIRAKVAERHLHKLKVEQEASAEIAGFPADVFGYFPGTVKSISQIGTPLTAGEGYFVVEIVPAATTLVLRPGLSADVRILVGVTSLFDRLVHID